jgi:signal peptidase II
MEKTPSHRNNRLEVIFTSIVILVFIADQVTKVLIRSNLAVGETLLDIGFFEIVYIQNTGAAFGIFQGFPYVFAVIQGIAILAILYIVIFVRRWQFIDNTVLRIGLALILAGTLGNFTDRLFFEGHVTDFLNFKFWPVFNVADSATVVGAILVCWAVIFLFKTDKQE